MTPPPTRFLVNLFDDRIIFEVKDMSATLELVLEQVKTLTDSERAKLVEVLTYPNVQKNGSSQSRLEKIRAFRGKYRGMLPSIEEFMADKRLEVELEERKWRR